MIISFANQYMSIVSRALIKYRLLRFLPWLVLAIFLLSTYQAWNNARAEAEQQLKIDFDYRVSDISGKIEQRMQSYERLLFGVQGLFAASYEVERREFHDYVEALKLAYNYPGMQGLGYNLLVPKSLKNQHINDVRKLGFPQYTIRPAGEREVYTTILYLEPFSGRNLQAIGYDTYTDPVRRAIMEYVRDTGLCTISPRIKLIQEEQDNIQAGFLMWLPVYKNGSSINTVAERRAHLKGWVSAAFRMGDMMHSIFSTEYDKFLNIAIYDGMVVSDKTLMFEGTHTSTASAQHAHFKMSKTLKVAEHHWTLVVSSLPGFELQLDQQKPRLIATAGIAVSILLALTTWILVFSHSQAVKSAQALNHELSVRKRAEVGMRLAEKVFETVDAAVLVTDANNRIIRVNPAFTDITGYTPEEAMGKSPAMLSSGAHAPEFYKEMWQQLKSDGSWQGEIYNRHKNGEFYTEWLSINEVRDVDGSLLHYVALFSDISERKAVEAHMHNLAHYDTLTGLPNRTLLSDRLQQAIAGAKREKSHMGLMFIDLDKFKPVNDTLGHHVGDLLLKDVAKRMLDCLRESDSAARIGGDEFVVLLPYVETEEDAVAVAEKIRLALNQPFELLGNKIEISSSIGVSVYPEHGNEERVLLRNADTAMYYAKESGRNVVKLYKPEMKHMKKGPAGRGA